MARLHYRHRQFLANYILLAGNGVQAVYAAGYKQGYDSACVTASRLLRNAKVSTELEKHAQKAQMSADAVLEELSNVAQIETKLDGTQKLKALELLGKFHKLFVDKTEITQKSEHSAVIEQIILKRAEKTGKSEEEIANSLLESFDGEPEFLTPEHWGKFAYLLSKPEKIEGIQ